MKTSSRIIILAAVMMLAAGNLHAQGATAAISATVLDPTGAAIPGASITVRNVGTAFTRSVISDDQGRYVAPELPIGEYEVQASLAGFQTVVRRGIRLTLRPPRIWAAVSEHSSRWAAKRRKRTTTSGVSTTPCRRTTPCLFANLP